jgi:hypothetical protein
MFVSAVVLVLGAFLILSLTNHGLMLRQAANEGGLTAEIADRHGGIWKVMSEVGVLLNFLINPVVSLSVGVTIGLIARDNIKVLAAICLVPFLTLFLFANSWSPKAIALGLGYLIVAFLAAQLVFRRRVVNHRR